MAETSEAEVLLLSDTHLHDAARLPAAVFDAAARADHIVHAGDVSAMEVLRVLETFAPVTAVAGNVEDAEVRGTLPVVARVEVAGVRFGVLHDAGPASGRHQRLSTRFDDCDVLVYGHSHQPEVAQLEEGRFVVNPGSPTQRRRSPVHTFAWASIAQGRVAVKLVQLVLMAAVAMTLAGCGAGEVGSAGSTGRTVTTEARDEPRVAVSADTLALQRSHEQLLEAIEPVSAHMNDVTTAVRLRDTAAAELPRVQRAGSGYAPVLVQAERQIAAVEADHPQARALRKLLLQLIRERRAALTALSAWASDRPGAQGSPIELRAAFDERWNSSIGTARAATNLLQYSRREAGLASRREDAIR